MIKSIIASAFITLVSVTAYAAQPAISPAKQELIQKVLRLAHVDDLGVSMLQEPVAKAVGQARVTLQSRAPAERHEAAMRDVAAEAKKFLDETTPIVKSSTEKLLPTTIVPLLAEKFTEDELRQLITVLESPVKKKFEGMIPEMQKTLGEKLAAETGSKVNPKLEEMTQRVGMRVRTAVTP